MFTRDSGCSDRAKKASGPAQPTPPHEDSDGTGDGVGGECTGETAGDDVSTAVDLGDELIRAWLDLPSDQPDGPSPGAT